MIQEDISAYPLIDLFAGLSHRPQFCYLDSSLAAAPTMAAPTARFSFMAFDPFLTLRTVGKTTQLIYPDKTQISHHNPFDLLDTYVQKYQYDYNLPDIPFCGGAVGYCSYESAQFLADFSQLPFPASAFPLLEFGFFDKVIVIDHLTNQKTFLYLDVLNTGKQLKFTDFYRKGHKIEGDFMAGKVTAALTQSAYIQKVKAIKQHIYEGDIYQANFTFPFTCTFKGNPALLYQQLRQVSPAPYAAFLNLSSGFICSASPEQFIKMQGRQIQTRPIKGTIARGQTAAADAANKAQLLASTKDRAELMMIVDLERNDLGRICEYGSVSVPQLFTVEEYAQVFQLVSTINGRLQPGLSHVQAFKALFPGGSITGAPKIRAMQIINQQETPPRNLYTGAIGYLGFGGQSEFNIAIRTIYSQGNQLFFHAGGGIVADSTPRAEWQEAHLKAQGLKQALCLSPLSVCESKWRGAGGEVSRSQ